MSRTFKVGDRVCCINQSRPVANYTGTILGFASINTVVYVSWDGYKRGHTCAGLAGPGSGWNVFVTDIELINFDLTE